MSSHFQQRPRSSFGWQAGAFLYSASLEEVRSLASASLSHTFQYEILHSSEHRSVPAGIRYTVTAAAWQMWVAGLPADPVELAQVRTGVQVEVKQAERRLAGVLATGGDSRAHRETLIELAKLNSKLRLLEARLEAGDARASAQTQFSSPVTSRS